MSSSEIQPLFAQGPVATLRLVIYLGLAIMLMVADHRADWLGQARALAGLLAEPLYRAVHLPVELAGALQVGVAERQRLSRETAQLREELLLTRARLNRLQAVQRENSALRQLLGVAQGAGMRVQLVSVLNVDLDPFRHRVLVDRGSRDGLRPGMPVVDATGVMGQVERVSPLSAQVLLLSDPAHAIPVQVLRSGVRLIAHGTGDTGRLKLPTIPLSADVEIGDILVTSGLGGRFPAGFPVGELTALGRDASGMFLEAQARPTAGLERSRHLLVLHAEPVAIDQPASSRVVASEPVPKAGRDRDASEAAVSRGED